LYQLCSMDCQCWSDCPIGFAVPGWSPKSVIYAYPVIYIYICYEEVYHVISHKNWRFTNYPLVNWHSYWKWLYSWFTCLKWWFSIVLIYQRQLTSWALPPGDETLFVSAGVAKRCDAAKMGRVGHGGPLFTDSEETHNP
jgi:hypothetical protein